MSKITWKAALGGGLVAGAGFTGLVAAQTDRPSLPVDGVQLRLASNVPSSPSRPVVVPTTALGSVGLAPVPLVVPAPVPAPVAAALASASVPAPPVPPAPPELPDICPGGDFTTSSWDDSCGSPPPPVMASAASPISVSSPDSPASPPAQVADDSPASAGSAGSAGS